MNDLSSFKSTGNSEIGSVGVTSLSEALKTNNTLTELYLGGKKKNKDE